MRNKSKRTVGIINAIQAGASIEDIAKKFKVTKQTIYNIKYKMKDEKAKAKSKAFTKIPQSTKFVPPRSLDLADTLKHNADLFNEIKDQQAIIRYLEGLAMRLIKSTSN